MAFLKIFIACFLFMSTLFFSLIKLLFVILTEEKNSKDSATTTYESTYVNHGEKAREVYRSPKLRFQHPEEEPRKTKEYIPISCDTLRPYKCTLPFDVFHTAKPITRTHPAAPYDPYKKPKREINYEVIKNRPRVYKAPELSMDDIEDPKIRKIIIDNIYTSDWKKKSREVAAELRCTKRKIHHDPYENRYISNVRYEYNLVTRFPKEYVEKCKKWEEDYPKSVINQTEMFWEKFEHPTYYKYKINDKDKDEIRKLVRSNELRLPFDIRMKGYMGYMPKRDIGSLKKKYEYKNPYKVLLKENEKKC